MPRRSAGCSGNYSVFLLQKRSVRSRPTTRHMGRKLIVQLADAGTTPGQHRGLIASNFARDFRKPRKCLNSIGKIEQQVCARRLGISGSKLQIRHHRILVIYVSSSGGAAQGREL